MTVAIIQREYHHLIMEEVFYKVFYLFFIFIIFIYKYLIIRCYDVFNLLYDRNYRVIMLDFYIILIEIKNQFFMHFILHDLNFYLL